MSNSFQLTRGQMWCCC